MTSAIASDPKFRVAVAAAISSLMKNDGGHTTATMNHGDRGDFDRKESGDTNNNNGSSSNNINDWMSDSSLSGNGNNTRHVP